MKKLTLLLFLAWGFLWETAGGQNLFTKHARVLTLPEGYVCYRTAGALDIDGRLDEASWQAAKETAPFVDISGKDFPAPLYDTRVKMLWDDDYLYVGARLEEKDIRARLTQRDTTRISGSRHTGNRHDAHLPSYPMKEYAGRR